MHPLRAPPISKPPLRAWEKTDPQAPEALNARLQYADFLAEGTTGDCQARLDAAQAQLDAVAARPATQVLLLLGPANEKGA